MHQSRILRIHSKYSVRPFSGMTSMSPRLDGRDRGLGQRLHLHEPLRRSARLDDRAAAVAGADGVGVVDYFFEQTGGLQIFDSLVARFESVKPGIFSGRCAHVGVVGHHVDFGQLVAAADFEVVGIVRRSNFHRAGAEFAIDVAVHDDRNFAIHQRQQHHLADQMLVALVLGMHGDRDVAQHRSRAAWSPRRCIPSSRRSDSGCAKDVPRALCGRFRGR